MLASDVITRLDAQVPALTGRVAGAADLSALIGRGELPQVTPSAHVVPAGMTGGKAVGLVGEFTQSVGRLISVVLSFRGRDKTATRGLDGIDAVIDAVIAAIIGWTPDPATSGLFELRGTRLVSLAADALVYQIDFILPDQLRIIS